MAANVALTGSIPWVNKDHGDAFNFCFVVDKCVQLKESPISKALSVCLSKPCPRRNTFELFQGNPSVRVFGYRDNFFGNTVVDVSLKPCLPFTNLLQMAFGRLGAAFLERLPKFYRSFSDNINRGTRKSIPVASSGKIHNALINSEKTVMVNRRTVWQFYYDAKKKLAVLINKIGLTFQFLFFQSGVLPEHDGNLISAINSIDTGSRKVREGQKAGVIDHGRVFFKRMLYLPVKPVRFFYLFENSDNKLRTKGWESRTNYFVKSIVHIKGSETSFLKSILRLIVKHFLRGGRRFSPQQATGYPRQNRRMKKLLAAVLIFLAYQCNAFAACSWSGNTGTVDISGTYTVQDIQDCVDDASGKTGAVIIQIPDSTLSANSTLITVNMKTGFAAVTSLTIKGQNACTLGFTDDVSGGVPTDCGTVIDKAAFRITGDTTKKVRMSNIEFTGATATYPLIALWGDTNYDDGGGFRLDHLLFNATVFGWGATIHINHNNHDWELMDGVIDHIYAYNVTRLLDTQPSGGDIPTNKDWIEPLGLGTSRAIYLEDSKLLADDGLHLAWEHQGGGRAVVRHNHTTNYWFGAHDPSSIPNSRGLRKYELYENLAIFDEHCVDWGVFANPRGGSGVVFNNAIDNTAQTTQRANYVVNFYIGRIANYASYYTPWNVAVGTDTKICASSPLRASIACTVETDCLGTNGVTNYCVNIDGAGDGDSLPVGYPARDQAGVLQNADGTQTGGGAPFLIWGNTLRGTPSAAVNVDAHAVDYVVADRDYCATTSATMPASCNGVETTYAPFTYPHPLAQEEGEEDTTAPVISSLTASFTGACVSSKVISFGTDENATCKWNLTDVAYGSMTGGTFTGSGTTSHSTTITPTCSQANTYYIRCTDSLNNASAASSTVTFTFDAAKQITVGEGANIFGTGGSLTLTR